LNVQGTVVISDEGLALKSAISSASELATHKLCAKHWIGYHKRYWVPKDSYFWELVTILKTTLKFFVRLVIHICVGI
jgi:hypothetical protein